MIKPFQLNRCKQTLKLNPFFKSNGMIEGMAVRSILTNLCPASFADP